MGNLKVIFQQKPLKKKVKISVIIPIRNDVQVYGLIDSLEKQKFKDFEVIFVNDSPKPFINVKKIPKKLNIKIVYSSIPLSIAEKLNFGSRYSEGDYYAITETDCIAGREWLSEAYNFIKGKKDTLLKGNEARNQDMSLANLVFTPSCIKKNPFDSDFGFLSDVQWRRSLQINGFNIETKNIGPIYHKCYGKGNYLKKTKRHFSDIWEYVYLYLKYPLSNFKQNLGWFLLNQIYGVGVSIISLIITLLAIPIHVFRLVFSK